jgi:hypothetical protein
VSPAQPPPPTEDPESLGLVQVFVAIAVAGVGMLVVSGVGVSKWTYLGVFQGYDTCALFSIETYTYTYTTGSVPF